MKKNKIKQELFKQMSEKIARTSAELELDKSLALTIIAADNSLKAKLKDEEVYTN